MKPHANYDEIVEAVKAGADRVYWLDLTRKPTIRHCQVRLNDDGSLSYLYPLSCEGMELWKPWTHKGGLLGFYTNYWHVHATMVTMMEKNASGHNTGDQP